MFITKEEGCCVVGWESAYSVPFGGLRRPDFFLKQGRRRVHGSAVGCNCASACESVLHNRMERCTLVVVGSGC